MLCLIVFPKGLNDDASQIEATRLLSFLIMYPMRVCFFFLFVFWHRCADSGGNTIIVPPSPHVLITSFPLCLRVITAAAAAAGAFRHTFDVVGALKVIFH